MYSDEYETMIIRFSRNDMTGAGNGGYMTIPTNLSGRYMTHLVGISADFDDTTVRQVEIRSPNFQVRAGNQRYPFFVWPVATHNYNSLSGSIFCCESYFNGDIQIQLFDRETNVQPTAFSFMYLTFKVKKL